MSSPQKKNINQNNNNNIDPKIQKLIEEPFVKDLLIKIEVLKKGLRDEKNKNNELSKKIEELKKEVEEEKKKNMELDKLKQLQKDLVPKMMKLNEELISTKSQIEILTKEKMELEKTAKQPKRSGSFFEKLNIKNNLEKLKSINEDNVNGNSNVETNNVEAISTMANTEIRKLNEEIEQLKFENEMCVKNMTSALEKAENLKLEFKNEIKTYNEKIKKLEEEIKMLQEERDELQDRIKLFSSISSQTIKETEHFKVLISDYKKGKEDAIKQLNISLEKYNKLKEENELNKKEIARYEMDSVKMAQKLTELKGLYIKVNLRNQMYHVKKVGLVSSAEIDIIFGRGEDGNYVMRIDSKEGMQIINIQDVESVNRVKNSKNKVEIKYMHKSKKYNMNVIVPELVVDQFVEAYKIFYFESMKCQNNFEY